MQTVKEIEAELKTIEEPTTWLKELENDGRVGVKKALNRWYSNYKKRQQVLAAFERKKAFDASYKPFQQAYVAGVDEAGRGPLAGPVVTAAVILPEDSKALIGLDDSKAISKAKREQLAETIKEIAIAYSIHIQPATVIDELNIYSATKLSMEKAVETLSVSPDFVIVDAMQLNGHYRTESVIKADAQSLAVAAASILAKTTRDTYMDDIHTEFPVYQFAKNAGYGTAEHVEALKKHGPCIHHRKSFEPVKSLSKV
ncbi:ribonuclease HII [Sporosarcina ureilytica]|uniref:Ribonuclease HII n=2 Tax=Sporosarcina ureilytica TaxID=298596 RepID=A0A1D8JHY3_9BACL|nr:ribonuclease HII [Sporosarcina ureilytica]AOV08284.1 ribonuclease HII [Sporosarcina ureilytica]